MKIKKKALSTGIGLVVGAVGGKVLTSKVAKKAAVATVQQGLKAKKAVDKTVETIKVSTEDIVAEAKVKNEMEEQMEAEAKAKLDIEEVSKEDLINDLKAEIINEIKKDLKEETEEE